MLSINTKCKKAISPIIAGIMLIAVALIAGLMVSTWSSTLVTKQTEKSPMCTLTTYYSIESATYDLATGIIRAKITNRGKDDLYNFSIEVDNGSITTITPFTPSSTYKLKQGRSILVKGHYPNLGNLNNIRVIPNSCPQKISQLKVNNLAISLDLVLNLHLDENTGCYTNDSSSYGNDGTLGNSTCGAGDDYEPSWNSSGKFGSALQFDGSDDYVDIIDIGPGLGDYSAEAWIKTNNITKTVGIVHGSGMTYRSFDLYGDYIKLAHYCSGCGGTISLDTGAVITSVGQWYHVAGTFSTSNGMKIYVDGVEVASNATATIPPSSNHKYKDIGYFPDYPTTDYYFDGTIDEVRIWSRALTVGEIIELAS